jgi:hypothetical protein
MSVPLVPAPSASLTLFECSQVKKEMMQRVIKLYQNVCRLVVGKIESRICDFLNTPSSFSKNYINVVNLAGMCKDLCKAKQFDKRDYYLLYHMMTFKDERTNETTPYANLFTRCGITTPILQCITRAFEEKGFTVHNISDRALHCYSNRICFSCCDRC